jgi:hypothetical protein
VSRLQRQKCSVSGRFVFDSTKWRVIAIVTGASGAGAV